VLQMNISLPQRVLNVSVYLNNGSSTV